MGWGHFFGRMFGQVGNDDFQSLSLARFDRLRPLESQDATVGGGGGGGFQLTGSEAGKLRRRNSRRHE